MKELKLQVQQIFNILEKIEINIKNSKSSSIDNTNELYITKKTTDVDNANIILANNAEIAIKIINSAAIKASNIVISTADKNNIDSNINLANNAEVASEIINAAAIKASNLVIYTAETVVLENIKTSNNVLASDNTNFDINMYLKCLIHEIRTPITNISLGINSIENNIIENKNNNEILIIINGLNKSLEYLDDVITKFCVIKNGMMVLNNFEPFSINMLITDIKIILQYIIEEKNIQLKWNINTNVNDNVYGDKINIKHCIVNLIKNAIKYSNKYQDTNIIVNISNFNEENQYQSILISVLDNNNYIPKNIKDKLFQPFNSTSCSGLGLYICKKILELHNGSIEHEYINPKGNQFNIFIDLKISINLSQNNINLEENSIITYNSNKKYNIIIIDDSEITIKLMSKIFMKSKKINYIMTACDGLDAIQKICNNLDEIDIVFIDSQMPNLNGMQTVKLLRGINFDKLIIGITGSYYDELSEFYYCGTDYIFSKPLDKHKIKLIMDLINNDKIVRQIDKKIKMVDLKLEWV